MNTLPKFKLIPVEEYEMLLSQLQKVIYEKDAVYADNTRVYGLYRKAYAELEEMQKKLDVTKYADIQYLKHLIEVERENTKREKENTRRAYCERAFDIWRLERIIERKKKRLTEYQDAIIRRNEYIKQLGLEISALKED